MTTTEFSPVELPGRLRLHVQILVDFAKLAGEATSMDLLFNHACVQVARAAGCHHSKLLVYDPACAEMRLVAGKGWKPNIVGNTVLGSDMASPPGCAFQTRLPVRIDDLPASPDFRFELVLRDHGIRSVLNAPVSIDGLVWGVIEVDSVRPNAFDEDDQQFMLAFALLLANAIKSHEGEKRRQRAAGKEAREILKAKVLLQEHNHRVRNYFQILLAILGSRRVRAKDEAMKEEYREILDRVTAVALAHDLLGVGDDQTIIDLAVYMEAVCASVQKTMSELGPRIAKELDHVKVRPNRAVPLGLITNELLTNAFKYGQTANHELFINVRLAHDQSTGEGILSVSDNGPGMGKGREGSQGLRLVRMLASQLSGHMQIGTGSQGTTVTVTFPTVL
jgi:two-component sensor histidine kinase